MIPRLAVSLLVLAILASPVLAGHHGHHGHSHRSGGSSGADDHLRPYANAFLVTMFFGILGVCFMLIGVGPILVIWVPRPVHTFWIIPLGNVLLYLLNISLTDYPDGFFARWRQPGLPYTIAEEIMLLLLSGLVALIIALIQWVVRKSRAFLKKPQQPATVEAML